MTAGNHEEVHDVKQAKKMVPFITLKTTFGQHVCELAFGVNIFDLDFGVQIDSVESPIKRDSVGTGHMSHCRTSAF